MKRGEVWVFAGGGDYTGRPRLAVILQADQFADTQSVTICAFTSTILSAPLARPLVAPNQLNGLDQPSQLMADKIMTVRRTRLHAHLGRLDDEDMVRLERAILVFLGLAG